MDDDFGWDDELNVDELISRFEEMVKSNGSHFFDSNEFEAIIDYYLDFHILDRAKIAIDLALQLHPSQPGLKIKSARLMALNGDFYAALETLNYLELIEPANEETFISKAEIYSQMEKPELAIEQYENALELSENPEELYSAIAFEYENMDDYPNAILSLRNALQIKPESENLIHEIAFFFDITQKEDEAISFFSEFIDEHPYSKIGWFNLGIFYNQKDMYEKAIEAYEFALAIDEKFSSAYFNIANSLSSMGKYAEAIENYKETFKYESPETITHCYIGESYESLNDYQKAAYHFEKAIEIGERHPDPWAGLGRVNKAKGELIVALNYYNKAIELAPENNENKAEVAKIHMSLENFGTAIKYLEDIVSSEGETKINVWIDLSECYRATDDMDQAIDTIEQALRENKENALLWYRLAAYLYISGKVQQAYYFIENALKLNYEDHSELTKIIPGLCDESRFIELLSNHKAQ